MAIMDYNPDMRVSREEGREEGISIGLTQGREAMATDIAIAMLRDNEPIEKIIKYSRLSRERIQDLKKQI